MDRVLRKLRRVARPAVACALLVATAGCRQDMHDQPRYEPLEPSAFFPDRQSSRHLIEGTVPRGALPADDVLATGRVRNTLVQDLPVPVTPELLARGRERYNIYCAPCHDPAGTGEGMIVQRGFRSPTSFHIDRLREAPAGHFFDAMTNGFGAMPDYRYQVSVPDRWAIVAYIRALQLSQHAPLDAVPPGERQRLGLAGDAPEAAAPPAAAGAEP